MSNTKLDNEHAKYKEARKYEDEPKLSIKLKHKYDRHNYEQGKRRNDRNKNKLKAIEIADNLN